MSKKKPAFKINYDRLSYATRAQGLKALCKVCNEMTPHGKPKTVGHWIGLFCEVCGAQNGKIVHDGVKPYKSGNMRGQKRPKSGLSKDQMRDLINTQLQTAKLSL